MSDSDPENERPTEKLRQLAERAIGPDETEDYRIHPTAFVAQLADTAPELSAVLGHSSLTETAKRYEQRDQTALAAQELFKRLSHRGTWAVFVATVAGALLAGLSLILSGDVAFLLRPVAILLGALSLVSGAVAAMMVYRLGEGRLLRAWMSSRADAEGERLGYFNRVTRRVVDTSEGDPKLLLLCLEFFRRYQLSVQQTFYRDRGASHGASRRLTLSIGAFAVAILSFGSGGFGLWGSVQPKVLPLAALGAIGAALAAVASRREELNQDERNAERYDRTSEMLSRIRERHSDVQRALILGESESFSNTSMPFTSNSPWSIDSGLRTPKRWRTRSRI